MYYELSLIDNLTLWRQLLP